MKKLVNILMIIAFINFGYSQTSKSFPRTLFQKYIGKDVTIVLKNRVPAIKTFDEPKNIFASKLSEVKSNYIVIEMRELRGKRRTYLKHILISEIASFDVKK